MLAAVFVTLVAPLAFVGVRPDGWRLLPAVVAPAVMMVLVFVILLDILMSRVFMADAGERERARLGTAIRIEAAVLLAMVAAWSPFLVRIFAD